MIHRTHVNWLIIPLSILILTWAAVSAHAADPLPSWNEGSTKSAIIKFVSNVTMPKSPDFVPKEKRLATFDNDGTLWCEQPIYVQAQYIIDRAHELAPKHPDWQTKEPFRSVLAGDLKNPALMNDHAIGELFAATCSGMTTEEFESMVNDWIKTAKHPRFHRLYTQCIYQPMLELLSYLRANEFTIYIVSGGGCDFMRSWTQEIYGIPKENVVGSTSATKFELRPDGLVLLRLPKINFIDDKSGKPVGIHHFIGQRPVAAFGNSDGDLEMLQWTTMNTGPRFGMIVHHDDAEREYAYDRHSLVGRLDHALDQAKERGWIVISMKNDWKTIFPPAGPPASSP